MQFWKLMVLVSMLVLSGKMQAASVENVQGPVHEAFLTPISGAVAYEAIQATPPEAILERIPEQANAEGTWIPGYWQWNDERNDFIWITGVWRKAPPGQVWISGFWKKFGEGWVWLRGFWSDKEESDLDYIAAVPPESIEENAGTAPGKDYFWMPGNWLYDSRSSSYNWVSGAWAAYDPDWVLVPAHYVWRDKGYALVNAYWDFKLENRGTIYTSLYIPKDKKAGYIYNPSYVVDPLVVCRYYVSWYPDYSYFYHYHYHFYPDIWAGWNIAPPWWGWSSWSSFSWSNNWALWWWWGTPGYPAPGWMTPTLAQQIAPPSKMAQTLFHDVVPPVIVTRRGVISSDRLVAAVQDNVPEGKRKPILPSNRKTIDKIAGDLAKTTKNNLDGLRPEGKPGSVATRPQIFDAKVIDAAHVKAVPAKPGMPNTLKTNTPGSEGKSFKELNLPRVPNLGPSLERAPQKDVFRSPIVLPAKPDRSDIRFANPEPMDRPPYNNSTRTYESVRAPDRGYQPANTYIPTPYKPVYQSRSLNSDLYNVPQASSSIIMKKPENQVQQQRQVNPFNPEGIPQKSSKPAYFPPRPNREREAGYSAPLNRPLETQRMQTSSPMTPGRQSRQDFAIQPSPVTINHQQALQSYNVEPARMEMHERPVIQSSQVQMRSRQEQSQPNTNQKQRYTANEAPVVQVAYQKETKRIRTPSQE